MTAPREQTKQKRSIFALEIDLGRVNATQRTLFAKNMSMMIRSGLPIGEALGISADSAQGSFKKVLLGVRDSVLAGGPLSDGLAQYPKAFSPLFINSVRAGEKSGTLEENLSYVSEQLRKEKELSEKIWGAMLYPIVVLIAALGLSIAIVFFVLPKITPLFEGLGVALPVTTRILIWISGFVQAHGASALVGLGAFIVLVSWLVRQKFSRPTTNFVILHLPVIKSLVRNSNTARFCRTLGTLIKSGLSIDEAVRISAETSSNYYYEQALRDVSRRLMSGTKLSSTLMLYENLFPKIVTRMIRVGEESGRLEETLLYLAAFFEEEVDADTKNLSVAIEPILLISIGLIVGFLALSIITPIYSITGNIGR